ncbi:hypothetical protein BaRGS_00033803, partial [Batillaria attramentaria]
TRTEEGADNWYTKLYRLSEARITAPNPTITDLQQLRDILQFGLGDEALDVTKGLSSTQAIECANHMRKHSDGISLHKFPNESNTRRQWIRFVQVCRADVGPAYGTPNNNSMICERNFTSDAYDLPYQLKQSLGIECKGKRLLEAATRRPTTSYLLPGGTKQSGGYEALPKHGTQVHHQPGRDGLSRYYHPGTLLVRSYGKMAWARQEVAAGTGHNVCGNCPEGSRRAAHQPPPKHSEAEEGRVNVPKERQPTVTSSRTRKRTFFLMSTAHNVTDSVAAGTDRQGNPRRKPKLVDDYNHHMKGVDNFDQHLAYYSFHRKTVKWWKRVAMHMIHPAKVQCFLLYKMSTDKPKGQYEFNLDLVECLTIAVPRLEAPAPVPMQCERLSAKDVGHWCTKILVTGYKSRPTRVCIACSIRGENMQGQVGYQRRKETRFQCVKCDVGLCQEPCFELYHTRVDFKAAVAEVLQL